MNKKGDNGSPYLIPLSEGKKTTGSTNIPMKVSFFVWLVIRKACPTQDKLTKKRSSGFVMLPVIVVMPSSLLFFFVFGFVALELEGLSKTTYLPPRDSGKVCIYSTLPISHMWNFIGYVVVVFSFPATDSSIFLLSFSSVFVLYLLCYKLQQFST
ncbi:hypothetical protein MTR67_048476 [Solanum verrucosum]|uniref:Uncharacterized protein n=1 Tax=Solanum verrucosum TaxID=315347 RepID=A0AAF0V1P0_SOLVR|nr:hypothetical protein MTR67_048476 [Solanum verrucosum]